MDDNVTIPEDQSSETEVLLRDHLSDQQSPSSEMTQVPPRMTLSPGPLSGKRRPSRILVGSEKIRLAEELRNRYTAEEEEVLQPVSGSSMPADSSILGSRTRAATTSIGSIRLTTGAPKLPRSASVAQVSASDRQSVLAPDVHPDELRRVKSEIIDPREKMNAQRASVSNVFTPHSIRERSGSGATRGHSTDAKGQVSQSRALAHEAISEERREAVQRRQKEDQRILSRIRHAGRWPRWFVRAQSNAVD